MLEAIPASAAYPHDAFAVAGEDLVRARAIAGRAATEGWASARAALWEWSSVVPASSRPAERTPLDPQLGALVAALAERAPRAPAKLRARLKRTLASFSDVPRDVAQAAEAQAAWAAARALRMIDEREPPVLLATELDILADALAALDVGMPVEAELSAVWLGDLLARVARHDLSLGTHTETLALLASQGTVGADPMLALRIGEPLVDWERFGKDDFDPILGMAADDLRFWLVGPAPASLAREADALADRVQATPPEARARISAQLDVEEEPALAGRDYVASLERRLRTIAARAQEAEREGLSILSREVRDLSR